MNRMIYLSHPIRGITQVPGKTNIQAPNVQMAIYVGRIIRQSIPGVDIYIPGEHQYFVQRAYDKQMLTDKQILEIDCDIMIKNCHYIVFYNPQGTFSQGMEKEKAAAQSVCLPSYTFSHITWEVLEDIRKLTLD